MSLMRVALPLLTSIVAIGCGPSPAIKPSAPSRATTPCEVVAIDDDANADADDDDVVVAPPPPRKPVEYVRMDEWQPPASVVAIEARIEPRGDRPHDYVRLPALTLHREIPPMTTWRVGRYWR